MPKEIKSTDFILPLNDLFFTNIMPREDLTATQKNILLIMTRYTNRKNVKNYNKDEFRHSYETIANSLGVNYSTVQRSIKGLVEKQLVTLIHSPNSTGTIVFDYKRYTGEISSDHNKVPVTGKMPVPIPVSYRQNEVPRTGKMRYPGTGKMPDEKIIVQNIKIEKESTSTITIGKIFPELKPEEKLIKRLVELYLHNFGKRRLELYQDSIENGEFKKIKSKDPLIIPKDYSDIIIPDNLSIEDVAQKVFNYVEHFNSKESNWSQPMRFDNLVRADVQECQKIYNPILSFRKVFSAFSNLSDKEIVRHRTQLLRKRIEHNIFSVIEKCYSHSMEDAFSAFCELDSYCKLECSELAEEYEDAHQYDVDWSTIAAPRLAPQLNCSLYNPKRFDLRGKIAPALLCTGG